MEKNEERKDMTPKTEEEMSWEEYLAKIHQELEAEVNAEIEPEEKEEQEEREPPALIERALETTEKPEVIGQWAQIRRSFLQYNQPERWLEMVKSDEATTYLQEIQEKTMETYLRIVEAREEKELWGQDQSGLKGLHICQRIARETKEEMIENLSI